MLPFWAPGHAALRALWGKPGVPAVRGAGAGPNAADESALNPAEVDAYWLQRRVGQCFPAMGAQEAQALAEQAFTILQVSP